MICPVCKRRRQLKSMSELAVPVTFTVNYETGERREYPAGTLVCETEWRKLRESTSEGQAIDYRGGWVRADGRPIFV